MIEENIWQLKDFKTFIKGKPFDLLVPEMQAEEVRNAMIRGGTPGQVAWLIKYLLKNGLIEIASDIKFSKNRRVL